MSLTYARPSLALRGRQFSRAAHIRPKKGSGMTRNKPLTLRHQQRQENIMAIQRGCEAVSSRGFCSIFKAEWQMRDQPCQPGAELHGALQASVTEGCSSLTQAHPAATRLFKLSKARTRFSGRLSSPPFYQRHKSQQRSS